MTNMNQGKGSQQPTSNNDFGAKRVDSPSQQQQSPQSARPDQKQDQKPGASSYGSDKKSADNR